MKTLTTTLSPFNTNTRNTQTPLQQTTMSTPTTIPTTNVESFSSTLPHSNVVSTSLSTNENALPPQTSPTSQQFPLAIVLGVVGGVCAILFVLIAIWFFFVKRKQSKISSANKELHSAKSEYGQLKLSPPSSDYAIGNIDHVSAKSEYAIGDVNI